MWKREGRRVPLSRILQIAPLLLRNIPPNKNGTKNNERENTEIPLVDTDFPYNFSIKNNRGFFSGIAKKHPYKYTFQHSLFEILYLCHVAKLTNRRVYK